jgi:hypothetical protein
MDHDNEQECCFCLEKMISFEESFNLLRETNDIKTYRKTQRTTNKCGHSFHQECAYKWYNDQVIEKQTLPICPLCRHELLPSPLEDSFPVRWLQDKDRLCALDDSAEKKTGFYVVGPYPYMGDVDYGHEQMTAQGKGNKKLYHGAYLCYKYDSKYKNENSDLLLALYHRTTCPPPSLSRKLVAIGDNILVVKTGRIINRLELKKLQ